MNLVAAARRKPTVVVAVATQMDCQLLANVIERQCRLQVVASPLNSTSAISAVQENRPDLVLISPRLEDGMFSGLQVAKALHASGTNSRIVMLIRSEDRELLLESFRCGARGVLSVNDSPQDLCESIAAVLRGDVWVSRTHLKYLVEAFTETRAPVLLDVKKGRDLTNCEDEILELLAAGLTDREIGDRLKLPGNRIRKYISGMLRKKGVSSRVELALLVLSERLRSNQDQGKAEPEEKFGT
jgi:two-component system nitrate/nitrite response regulator NarL